MSNVDENSTDWLIADPNTCQAKDYTDTFRNFYENWGEREKIINIVT
jgi:hypothetical protein